MCVLTSMKLALIYSDPSSPVGLSRARDMLSGGGRKGEGEREREREERSNIFQNTTETKLEKPSSGSESTCMLTTRCLTWYLVRVAILALVVRLHCISDILIHGQPTHLIKKLVCVCVCVIIEISVQTLV